VSLFRGFIASNETSQENEKHFPEEMEEGETLKHTAIYPQIRCPCRLSLSSQPPSLAWQDSPWLWGFTPHGLLEQFLQPKQCFSR